MSQDSIDFRESLYTINKDGNRKWVYPSVVHGRVRRTRTVVAWLLVIFYLVLPWVTIGGEQAVRLDIVNRKFVFFGSTFWATDSYFLAIILGVLAVSLFFFTALAGRVWCGWACPETVFLEFVYRPIEQLIEGRPAERLRLDAEPWNWRKIRIKGTKLLAFVVVSWVLASSAVAFFVGRAEYLEMVQGSPLENWGPFSIMAFLMALCMFQFGWFREQFCTILCPYARFQSVLLDSQSLVVGYDNQRGEPRGKLKKVTSSKSSAPEHGEGNRVGSDASRGDCIDCGLCVRVCPTGIDIRNGLQLECIHCAACVDACNSVMERIGKPTGLVRYDTEAGFKGRAQRFLRPRVAVYLGILMMLSVGLAYLLYVRSSSEVQIVRGARDVPFNVLDDGRVSNHLHVHISNKGDEQRFFKILEVSLPEIEFVAPLSPFPVAPQKSSVMPVFFNFPKSILSRGRRKMEVVIGDDTGWQSKQIVSLLGPE